MDHKNYRQYANHREMVKPVDESITIGESITIDESIPIEEVLQEVFENPTEETVSALEEVIEETTEEKVIEQFGFVSGCSKLNIRKAPNVNADIECIVNEGSELKIDESKSIEGWFKVCAANGIDGYCMSKFVEIK